MSTKKYGATNQSPDERQGASEHTAKDTVEEIGKAAQNTMEKMGKSLHTADEDPSREATFTGPIQQPPFS